MAESIETLRAKAIFFGVHADLIYGTDNWMVFGEYKHLQRPMWAKYDSEQEALEGFFEQWRRKQRGEPWLTP